MRDSSRILVRPLFIIIYLNNFEKCLHFSQANIYADDTAVIIPSNNITKMIEDAHKEMSNIVELMRVNKLSPNHRNLGS